MEDKRIEELLRESWRPEPPEGMRERILNRAGRELSRPLPRFPRPAVPRWQLAFISGSLFVVLACNLLGTAQEARIASLVQSDGGFSRVAAADRTAALLESRAEISKLLTDSSLETALP